MVPHKGGVGQSEIDIPPKMDGSDWKRSKKWTHGVLMCPSQQALPFDHISVSFKFGRTLTYKKVSARNE